MKYDYLIVGSGLFGSVFAYEMTKRGKKCLVIEKRGHIGGNVYTEEEYGINVHKYGAHISTQTIKRFGITSINLQSLTVIQTHLLLITKANYITFLSI